MKALKLTTAVCALALGAGDQAWGQAPAKAPRCPVMTDEVIDINTFIDTEDGKRIYFCCSSCPRKYNRTPARYEAAVKAQQRMLVSIPKTQVTCPVSGRAVDPKVSIDHDGKKVYFCCTNCVGKFKSDPGQYKNKLLDCYTFQTKCPVMGEGIDPTSFSALASGEKVYYCCDGCADKFLADTTKYGAKMPSFYKCADESCKDQGALSAGKCTTCGKRRKQIGQGLAGG